MYHVNVNVNLMVENVTQIKSRTTINIGVGVKFQKNDMCVKKIVFSILVLVPVKIVNI